MEVFRGYPNEHLLRNPEQSDEVIKDRPFFQAIANVYDFAEFGEKLDAASVFIPERREAGTSRHRLTVTAFVIRARHEQDEQLQTALRQIVPWIHQHPHRCA